MARVGLEDGGQEQRMSRDLYDGRLRRSSYEMIPSG